MAACARRATRRTLGALLAALILAAGADAASAAEQEEFLGVVIDVNRVDYVVTRDVNVRERPETESKRIGGLKVGEKVVGRGRHQGWVAIEQDGKPFGFAYFKYLVPFLDGALGEAINGRASVRDGSCDYEITFDGKSKPEGSEFEFSDYTVSVGCDIGGKDLAFELFAFMTEGPYARNKDGIHQVGVDLLAIAEDFDHVLSTIMLYDHRKGELSFDQITMKEYAGKPATSVVLAGNVAEAIDAAVTMTLTTWNDAVWEKLAEVLG